MIRILIVESHRLLGKAVGAILSRAADCEVLGYAVNRLEAEKVTETQRPDVIVAHSQAWVAGSRSAAGALHPAPTVLLVAAEDSGALEAILTSEAAGCLYDDCTPEELVEAVRRVARGETVLAPGLQARLLRECRRIIRVSNWRPPPESSILSDREREVLTAVVRGRSNKQIAHLLGIEVATVKSHLNRVYEKLQVQDRTQAAVKALLWGLVDSGELPPGGFSQVA